MTKEPIRLRDMINNPDYVRSSSEKTIDTKTGTMSIALSGPTAYYLLNPPPAEASIITPAPSIKKGFGLVDEFIVEVTFDVTKFIGYALAAWIVRSVSNDLRSVEGDRNLNSDYIAKDESAAIEAIARKIDQKKSDDDDC